MVDEQFMRHWALHHDQFTEDMHRGLVKVLRYATCAFKRRFGMSKAYASRKLLAVPTSQSIMAGFAASAMTLALFVGAWAVSVPSLTYA